jgi:hypothetical protein
MNIQPIRLSNIWYFTSKKAFSLILYFALSNSIITVASNNFPDKDFNDNAYGFIESLDSSQTPFIIMDSVVYFDMVLGKDVELKYPNLTSGLLDKIKSAEITEQFSEQALMNNSKCVSNLKSIFSRLDKTLICGSLIFNKTGSTGSAGLDGSDLINNVGLSCVDDFGLSQFNNIVFNEQTSQTKPMTAAIDKNTPQAIKINTISIPVYEYILYKWGAFLLGCLIIIEGIIRFIDFVLNNKKAHSAL